jgi:hypothetical protein
MVSSKLVVVPGQKLSVGAKGQKAWRRPDRKFDDYTHKLIEESISNQKSSLK